LTWTGERYLPWLEEAAIGYEHIHRYAHATSFVRNKRVLDLACGEGYGSHLLSKTAQSVLGIDIDDDSIKHARNTYIAPTLEFRVGSITDIPIAGGGLFDVAVCFEALEHVTDHHRLLGEVKRLLTSDGLFIVSTPNKILYSDEPQFTNAFHVHELYFDEFKELLTAYFTNVTFLGQRIYCNSNIWPLPAPQDAPAREYVVEKHTDGFALVDTDKKNPLYFIALASDAGADIDANSSALVDVSNALLDQKDSQIAAHVTEQERLGGEIRQLSAEAHRHRTALAEGHWAAAKLQGEKDILERDLQKQRTQIDALIKEQAAELSDKDQHIEALEAIIRQRDAALSHIHASHGWKALTMYYQLRDKLLPAGTQRTKIAKSFWKLLGSTRYVDPPVAHAAVHTPGAVHTPVVDQGGTTESATTPSSDPILIKPRVDEDAVLMQELTVSVVIPTKNAGEDFRRLLATLRNQRGFRQIEIIVVDSGSTDTTVELADEFGCTVINIRPEDFSHSYARNLGASHASGEYLLFTVQDALPPSDAWLYELFSVIKTNAVVAVSCAEFPWESADLFYRAISWNHYRFLEVDKDDRIMRYAGRNDHLTLRKNGQLSDLACLISKEVFTRYQYQTDYGEDLDLGLRLIKDGYDIAFLGSTRIIHSHNRPAYYYLKRGYVENMFLPRIFSDYPTLEYTLERVIPDVHLTHSLTHSLVADSPWGLNFPCKTSDFSRRLLERFHAASTAGPLLQAHVADDDLADVALNDFLGRLVKDHPVAPSGPEPGDGGLIDAVRHFTEMILAYMEDAYELVDAHIAEEFRACLSKMFAYQCGARLSLCNLWNDERDRPQLERIHRELSKGV